MSAYRLGRSLLLTWVALYVAYRLGFGDPLGVSAFDALLAHLRSR